ncbi:endonuclease/exonuclease/phosphatase family protein [Candidatus Amarolinea aalborgensis]|jgi:endonuclease/exonuclease/phosphatase family metal-dependent hydrolase|uniref:endonuclease/exonuclease/phosphatase family protein n=1 Tax=Candidatus Amarolinea aalborgensis TaxID=2249329 RepID=UPI003BF9E413
MGFKRRRLAWLLMALAVLTLWMLNASQPGAAVEGCLAACANAARPDDGSVRIVSLNVLHDFPRFAYLPQRLDLIAAEIRRLDADIVLLQEAPWTWRVGSGAAYLGRATGLNYGFLRANGNRWAILFEEGEAILSRFPLRDVRFTELRPREAPFQHRVAVSAVVDTALGPLRVVSAHLANQNPTVNQAQAASLAQFVAAQPGPTIISGDFNAAADSAAIRALQPAWVDSFAAVRPDDPGLTCCVDDLTAPPDEPLEERIDYLFLSPGPASAWRVRASQRLFTAPQLTPAGRIWASDHIGLWLVLESLPK